MSSQTESAAAESLKGQLREMYGRLAYTHKTHEKMADSCISKYRTVKAIEIVLSALSSGSLVVSVLGDSRAGALVGAVLSTVLLGLLLYFKEGAIGEMAQRHTETAAKLWGLREKLLSLLVDFNDGLLTTEVQARRDQLNGELERVYRGAPRTSEAAYAKAQVALKKAEELYFTDAELNRLLPRDLRSPNP